MHFTKNTGLDINITDVQLKFNMHNRLVLAGTSLFCNAI